MRSEMASIADLERIFTAAGINFDRPGFYDDPAFVAANKTDPRMLEHYAKYVEQYHFTSEYLNNSRTIVHEMVDYLFQQLTAERRIGACADASGLLMRMLERSGIWCYMAGGAAILEFPPRSGFAPRYFWPIMHPHNNATTGHAWLCVPPYKIVDLTLPLQPYSSEERRFLSTYLLAERTRAARADSIDDLMENEAVQLFIEMEGRLPTLRDLRSIAQGLIEFMHRFPGCRFRHGELQLKYIPTQITVMDAPLEDMCNIELNGRLPADIYADFLAQRSEQ